MKFLLEVAPSVKSQFEKKREIRRYKIQMDKNQMEQNAKQKLQKGYNVDKKAEG